MAPEVHILCLHRIVLPAIGRDDSIFRIARAAAATRVQEDDVAGGLQDARGRAGAWDAERLALEDRVVLVGPHIEFLDLVPELWLVDGPVHVGACGELAVFRLVGVLAALHLVGRAAPRREHLRQVAAAVVFRWTPAATAGAPA